MSGDEKIRVYSGSHRNIRVEKGFKEGFDYRTEKWEQEQVGVNLVRSFPTSRQI